MLYHCKQLDSCLVHPKRIKMGIIHRWNKKEFLERIIGNFKNTMYSSLIATSTCICMSKWIYRDCNKLKQDGDTGS